jgi:hypothetical protein
MNPRVAQYLLQFVARKLVEFHPSNFRNLRLREKDALRDLRLRPTSSVDLVFDRDREIGFR